VHGLVGRRRRRRGGKESIEKRSERREKWREYNILPKIVNLTILVLCYGGGGGGGGGG